MYGNDLIYILCCKYNRDNEEMFVLHSDCSNLFKKCRYCCSEESTKNNDQTSDSQQVQPTPEQPSTETFVDESNVSTDSENPTDVVLNNVVLKISCEDMKTLLFSIKQDDMIVLAYQQTIL